jgi:hypothetical protein
MHSRAQTPFLRCAALPALPKGLLFGPDGTAMALPTIVDEVVIQSRSSIV